jgi:Flp pilus assembly protein TadD
MRIEFMNAESDQNDLAAEGINLHERARERDAVAPLEKAIELDPGFAMTLIKLSVVENNLGHTNRSE